MHFSSRDNLTLFAGSSPRRTSKLQRLARALATTALAGVALLWGSSPALAHDELVGTAFEMSETGGQVEAVVLSYSAVILDVGTEIIVTGPDGSDASGGEPEQDGRDVRQVLAENLPDGMYDFVWRVVSSDGHPIEGAFSFEIAEGSEPTVLPFGPDAAEAADEGDGSQGSETDSAEDEHDHGHEHSGAAEDTHAEDGTESTENAGSDLPLGLTIGIIAAIVVAGASTIFALSRTRRAAGDNADSVGGADAVADSGDTKASAAADARSAGSNDSHR